MSGFAVLKASQHWAKLRLGPRLMIVQPGALFHHPWSDNGGLQSA